MKTRTPPSPIRFKSGLCIALLLAACGAAPAIGQTPDAAGGATPSPAADPDIAGLRTALSQVGSALSSLRIARWKAPGELRESTSNDVDSIQRDLTVTLPPLLDQAQVSGAGILAPSFAIFRNIDALYDVLLRVAEMATLTGSQTEANRLEDARAALEAARGHLGSSLLKSMNTQDAQLAHYRDLAIQAEKAKPQVATPPAQVVVDDGPTHGQAHPKRKTKKKPAPPPPPQ